MFISFERLPFGFRMYRRSLLSTVGFAVTTAFGPSLRSLPAYVGAEI